MSKITLPDSFPNLPASVQKIQKMFASGNLDVPTLVRLLEQEPLLSANILKLVNSPYYGLHLKVSSIKNAVALLGTTVIRGIVMATVLKKSFPLDLSPYKISIEQFDAICIARMKLLQEWHIDKNLDFATLSSAAFLMESGKIVTSNEILKNGFLDIFLQLCNNSTLLEAEKALFDKSSYEIASLLFREWGFDDAFIELISNIANPLTTQDKILHIVATAINSKGILEDTNIQAATELLYKYELDLQRFAQALKKIEIEI
ncbi:MAG: HDOD domain-containing protein [Sulfurimonas sp.]|uniref:HDOD domain-containing protein n=1 Tax=Sulfurimonas sp. TaxID=2022749 RepID=UPI002633A042|nr:HDOD domain-containing protein [Sulfurimonas sp.]MDD2652887.1 HDOD domain-containing protein [Sulfurimonas sp.]MDD3452333.1 HDOD domain-containing protein [Sulfurimonas sp.]